jgi:hypothetical protein
MEILYEEGTQLKVVVFDATLRYVMTSAAMVTTHPVERGQAITDHIRPEPLTFTADVFVTNTPIVSVGHDGATGSVRALDISGERRDFIKGAQGKNAAEYETKRVTASAQVLQFSDTAFDRILAVWEILNRICTEGILVTVVNHLGDFDNVALTRVTAPREARGSVTYTIEGRQIKLVDAEVVEVEPLETRAERARRLGAVGTEEVESGDISFAAQALEALTDFDLLRPARRSGSGALTR